MLSNFFLTIGITQKSKYHIICLNDVIPSEKKLRKITLLCQFKKKFFICNTSYTSSEKISLTNDRIFSNFSTAYVL